MNLENLTVQNVQRIYGLMQQNDTRSVETGEVNWQCRLRQKSFEVLLYNMLIARKKKITTHLQY